MKYMNGILVCLWLRLSFNHLSDLKVKKKARHKEGSWICHGFDEAEGSNMSNMLYGVCLS